MSEIFKELIKLFSQYNFLVNIIPGSVLCILLNKTHTIDLISGEPFYSLIIIFYFIGVVNNRFSSLVIEPILKRKGGNFVPYDQFIEAESKDTKITLLSNENNVMRSYVSVMLLVVIAWGIKKLVIYKGLNISVDLGTFIFLFSLLILFFFSFKKQTSYVRKRIEKALKKESDICSLNKEKDVAESKEIKMA